MSLHKKLRRDSGGQAVVETALVLPLLLLLLMGIIEFGRLGNAYLAVTHAARHGVRHAAVSASDSDIVSRVQAATTHLAGGNITVEVTPVPALRRSGRDVTVTVSYPVRLYLPFANLVFTANSVVVRSSLTMRVDDITASALESYLLRHFSGIDILPAPLFPQEAEYISAEQTGKLLKLLREGYDYVIVDTAANFNEINIQVLELADQILLLLTKDLAAIKNTRTSLSILELLDLREKVRFVLNRSDQNFGVEIPDLEKGLGITVSHLLPCDERAITAAINKGVPVVISSPAAEISRSYRRLGERMATGRRLPAVEKEGKNLLNRIFSL